MTEQPDMPAELLERVAKLLIGFHPLWAGIAWERLPDQVKKRALSNARAVAPDLIAHGRELEKAAMAANPVTADFMLGVPAEAAHQRERWGVNHDAGKTPFDWFWLVGYLAQKAAQSAVDGNTEKALHHTISTAAALANWHAALTGKSTSMRPGIEPPNEHRSKP